MLIMYHMAIRRKNVTWSCSDIVTTWCKECMSSTLQQASAAAGQANLIRQQEELERKAAELERKEQELQNRAAGRATNTGGELV